MALHIVYSRSWEYTSSRILLYDGWLRQRLLTEILLLAIYSAFHRLSRSVNPEYYAFPVFSNYLIVTTPYKLNLPNKRPAMQNRFYLVLQVYPPQDLSSTLRNFYDLFENKFFCYSVPLPCVISCTVPLSFPYTDNLPH